MYPRKRIQKDDRLFVVGLQIVPPGPRLTRHKRIFNCSSLRVIWIIIGTNVKVNSTISTGFKLKMSLSCMSTELISLLE